MSGSALTLLLIAGGLLALSGAPGLLLRWRSPWGPRIATTTILVASAIGLIGAVASLGSGRIEALYFASPVPGERAALACDPLSAFFVLPVFVVGSLGSIYGLAYWRPTERPKNGRRLRFCYGLLLGSMTFVALAGDGISFLVAWEIMALAGYFLVATDEGAAGTRQAGWLYLVYSHAGTLCLVGFFALLAQVANGFALRSLSADQVGPGRAGALAALALVGFGIKAGAIPFHSWLPSAHSSAPSHVSAVMSGVMLKMGVYGLFRASSLLPPLPVAWGATFLVLGSVSCLLAIAFALAQHDIKRLLAYSSIENIGIILLGLGLALVGRSLARPEWVLLGLAGALLHVWNHSVFKSLLFFGAGSVVHATGTRNLELTGGLAKHMPATATLFLLGAVSICGLPPLNGFVSELLVYLGLASAATAPGSAWAALPVPVLAATGALALACFVKVFGVVFLGTPRSPAAERAHESPRLMLVPMAILALVCVAIGTLPTLLVPTLEHVVTAWTRDALPGPSLAQLAPLDWIPWMALTLLAASAATVAAVAARCARSRRRAPELPTWGCAYAIRSPRLEYTASSFAQIITQRFTWALRPRVHAPSTKQLFPAPDHFQSHVEDAVLESVLQPIVARIRERAGKLRVYQQGNLHQYVMFIAMAIAVLLLFNLRVDWLFAEICGR